MSALELDDDGRGVAIHGGKVSEPLTTAGSQGDQSGKSCPRCPDPAQLCPRIVNDMHTANRCERDANIATKGAQSLDG